MSNNKTITATRPSLAIRLTGNPNHHLWFNNGTWWAHWTEHLPDFTKRRVRRSLHTRDLGIARVLRDTILQEASGARTDYEEELTRDLNLAVAA